MTEKQESIILFTAGALAMILAVVALRSCKTDKQVAVLEAQLQAPATEIKPEVKPEPSATRRMKATWYGGKFYENRWTSSGLIKHPAVPKELWQFKQANRTCAHWTLPFGTLVDITWNGKTAKDVMVTDRGPLPSTGRQLDMSKGVADELGFTTTGIAEVEVRVRS